MFQKKMPVSQKPFSNEYTEFIPHDPDNLSKREWPDIIQVISIDPGIRNLALRVESRPIRESGIIKTIVFEKLRIKDDERKLVGNIDNLYFLISQFLDRYLDIFKKSHIMLIERQLALNYRAVRISQHIITYFLILFKNMSPTYPMVFEVDSKLKGKELGASKHLNERGLKSWSVSVCKSLLAKRKDYEGLAILEKCKTKLDDHADCVTMTEAFFSFQKWPLTEEIITLKIGNNNPLQINNDLPVIKNKVTLKILSN